MSTAEDFVAQFADDPLEESLEHFGVKGMKWGVTRKNTGYKGSTKTKEEVDKVYRPANQVYDKRMYGRGGVKRIQREMEKGATLKEARAHAKKVNTTQRRVATAVVVGTFVAAKYGPQLMDMAKYGAATYANNKYAQATAAAGAKATADMMSSTMGLTSTSTIDLAFDALDGVWK